VHLVGSKIRDGGVVSTGLRYEPLAGVFEKEI
jgi:hypothetical protein